MGLVWLKAGQAPAAHRAARSKSVLAMTGVDEGIVFILVLVDCSLSISTGLINGYLY
jgi:hypothetical protein